MDGEGATASTDAYAIAYIVPPDPSLPESPLKAGDDPFAVDETPPTGSALTAAAKPASPWAMWASPCAPWNSAKALPAAAAPAAKASLLAAIQAKKSEEKTDEEKAAIMMQKIRRGTLARRAGDAGGTKVKGWGAVRAARRRYSVAQRLQGLTAMPGYAVKAARSGDWRLALSRAYLYLKGALRIKGALQIFRGGPQGQPGQYGGVRSRVAKKSLNPVWKREWMEVRLQGGVMSEDGEYDNPDAPYSWLRLEVWDRDAFTADDFIGEVTLPLCPLMDARSHHYELKLEDPEGKSAADNGVQGSITFELAYLS